MNWVKVSYVISDELVELGKGSNINKYKYLNSESVALRSAPLLTSSFTTFTSPDLAAM